MEASGLPQALDLPSTCPRKTTYWTADQLWVRKRGEGITGFIGHLGVVGSSVMDILLAIKLQCDGSLTVMRAHGQCRLTADEECCRDLPPFCTVSAWIPRMRSLSQKGSPATPAQGPQAVSGRGRVPVGRWGATLRPCLRANAMQKRNVASLDLSGAWSTCRCLYTKRLHLHLQHWAAPGTSLKDNNQIPSNAPAVPSASDGQEGL